MTAVELHIALNHFPVIGIYFGLLCFVLALLLGSADLRRLGLGIFVLIGVLAVPVYLTGNAAEETVEKLEGVSHETLERHESLAPAALGASLVLGIVSGIALARERRKRPTAAGMTIALVVLAVAAAGALAVTANVGGKIRRPEIRDDAAGGGASLLRPAGVEAALAVGAPVPVRAEEVPLRLEQAGG